MSTVSAPSISPQRDLIQHLDIRGSSCRDLGSCSATSKVSRYEVHTKLLSEKINSRSYRPRHLCLASRWQCLQLIIDSLIKMPPMSQVATKRGPSVLVSLCPILDMHLNYWSSLRSRFPSYRSPTLANSATLKMALLKCSCAQIPVSSPSTVSSNMPPTFPPCNNDSQTFDPAPPARALADQQIPSLQVG